MSATNAKPTDVVRNKMIHETPDISSAVRKYLHSDNIRDKPILTNYPGFKDCFVYLHPFLQITDLETSEMINWANKLEVEKTCISVQWNEILKLTAIRNIQSLDRSLAFLHRAYQFAERTEYKKLRDLLDEKLDLIAPQVDELPEIIENRLLHKLLDLGYESVFIYSDVSDKGKLFTVRDILAVSHRLQSHVRIETPDSKILIVQDFDQRFSYFLSNRELLNDLIHSLDLEGFFCNDDTPESWSYYDIPKKERIDVDEDMKRK